MVGVYHPLLNKIRPKAKNPGISFFVTILSLGALLGLLAVVSASSGQWSVLAALLVIPFMALVLVREQWFGIAALMLVLFLQSFPTYFVGFLPPGTFLSDDLIIVLLILGWATRCLRKGSIRVTVVDVIFAVAISFMVLRAIGSVIPARYGALGIWHIVGYWPLFIIAHSAIRARHQAKQLLRLIMVIGWLQVAFVSMQWIYFLGFTGGRGSLDVDLFGGTLGLGSAHVLGTWMAMLIVLVLSLSIRGSIRTSVATLSIVGFTFVLLSTGTRNVYFILPAGILITILLSRLNLMKKLVTALLAPSLALLSGFLFARLAGFTIGLRQLVAQQSELRIAFIEHSLALLGNRVSLLVGSGPASFASRAGLLAQAPLATEVSQAFAHDPALTSAAQWPVLAVEYGIVGLILIVSGYLGMFALLDWIRRNTGDPLIQPLSTALMVSILILGASGFVERSLEFQVLQLHIMSLAGVVVGLVRMEPNLKFDPGRRRRSQDPA